MHNYDQINDYPAGDYIVLNLSVAGAGAGTKTISMQPAAQGIEDIIIAAWAYHNDATARTIQWNVYDALHTTTATMESSGAVAAYIKHSLYNLAAGLNRGTHQFTLPLRATRQVYPQVNFVDLDAGDTGYIHAIVLRRYSNAA